MNHYDVIQGPVVTEKSETIRALEQTLCFKVHPDATKTDISPATKVLLYLLPESNELLRPKFEEQLREGVIVVTHNYHIPGWDHKQVTSLNLEDEFGQNHSIFVYKR